MYDTCGRQKPSPIRRNLVTCGSDTIYNTHAARLSISFQFSLRKKKKTTTTAARGRIIIYAQRWQYSCEQQQLPRAVSAIISRPSHVLYTRRVYAGDKRSRRERERERGINTNWSLFFVSFMKRRCFCRRLIKKETCMCVYFENFF